MNGVHDLPTDREGIIKYILHRLRVPVQSGEYQVKEIVLRAMPDRQLAGMAREAHARQVQLQERRRARLKGRRGA